MPPERPIPGSPADWLTRARSDLAIARAPLPDGALYEDLCFHAQQAAEKAIKAVYRANQLAFRYTHDLEDLLTELKNAGIQVAEDVEEAVELTTFARQARYPGPDEPVTEKEYQEALRQAEKVLAWAEEMIGSPGSDSPA